MLSIFSLADVISLSLLFLMQSLSHRIDASTPSSKLSSPFFTSFRYIYCLFMSSHECKTLSIVNDFLVLLCICLSSFLIHFKTRIHVCPNRLAFSTSILSWILLIAIPDKCQLLGHLPVLVIIFPCYLSIQVFILLYSFCSQILPQYYFASFAFGCWYILLSFAFGCWYILLSLHSVVGILSCILHILVIRFFSLFGNVLFCLYWLILSLYFLILLLLPIDFELSL